MCAYGGCPYFIKVDASKWEVLNLVKEVFSLNLPQKVESLHNWWPVLDTLSIFIFCDNTRGNNESLQNIEN
jgi:hypothetical protein